MRKALGRGIEEFVKVEKAGWSRYLTNVMSLLDALSEFWQNMGLEDLYRIK